MAARETVTSGDKIEDMERYFKWVDSPFLPAEQGELSKVVPSKSIKEANKTVIFFLNMSNNDTVIKNGYSMWIFNISSLTLAKQLFFNYRNPSILVVMVSSNATGDY